MEISFQKLQYSLRKKIKLSLAKNMLLAEKPLVEQTYQDLSKLAELHIVFNSKNTLSALNALKSFYTNAQIYIPLYLHFDGIISEKSKRIFLHHIPFAQFISTEAEQSIKTDHFPKINLLRKKWQGKKLIDMISLSKTRKTLIIDDDVFFFKKPTALIKWIKTGKTSVFMQDCGKYCIISDAEMSTLFNVQRMKEDLNTGILGVTDLRLNFQEIEEFLTSIHNIYNQRELGFGSDVWRARNIHLIEQTVFYYLLSKSKNYKALPKTDYFLHGLIYKNLATKPSFRNIPAAIHFTGDADREKVFGYYLRKKIFDSFGIEF